MNGLAQLLSCSALVLYISSCLVYQLLSCSALVLLISMRLAHRVLFISLQKLNLNAVTEMLELNALIGLMAERRDWSDSRECHGRVSWQGVSWQRVSWQRGARRPHLETQRVS